jgi:hypothetical protein
MSRRGGRIGQSDEDVQGGTKKRNHVLDFAKFAATAAAGAIVGAMAVDKYREYKEKDREEDKAKKEAKENPAQEDKAKKEAKENPAHQAMQALFGVPGQPNPFAGPLNVNVFSGAGMEPPKMPEPPKPPEPPSWMREREQEADKKSDEQVESERRVAELAGVGEDE